MAAKRKEPPSVQDNDTAPRTMPHSSGDRTVQPADLSEGKTYRGGVYRRPNLDAPERRKMD